MATSLLLEIGEIELANQVAVARHSEFADVHYTSLTQLLKELPVGTQLIHVIIYRSLIEDILDSSRSKAYGHAARYLNKIAQLDVLISRETDGYISLITHQDYVIKLTQKHGKKRSFWEKVKD